MTPVLGFPYYPYAFGDTVEERRKKKQALQLLSLGRNVTPWAFIKTLESAAIQALIDGVKGKLPSYISEEYLEEHLTILYHRKVGEWNVAEKIIFDKEGRELKREYYSAEFRITPCWRGKAYPKEWIGFEWEDGVFKIPIYWDIRTLAEIISENSEIPEGRGFQVEVEVD